MAKRANGQGSEWYDARRGLFFAAYTRGLRPDGTPEIKRFASRLSADEARRKRDEDRELWVGGTPAPRRAEQQTVGQFLRRRWLPTLERDPETLRRYEHQTRLHVDPERPSATSVGHVRLRSLRPDQLQRLYGALPRATAKNVHAMLHAAFARAVKWGDLVRNPADLVDAPRYEPPEMRPPSEEQVVHFFASRFERDDPWLDVWLFLADTGCRPGEMLGAEWNDVDARGEWFVQRQRSTVTTADKKAIKNRQRRRVQLTERLLTRLRERRGRQDAQRARAGDAWQELGLVFANRTGGPLLWGNVTPEFRRALEEAGLPRFSPYEFFRHAHVTIGLASGVALQDMSRRTGHSVPVLARVYAHRHAERDREAAAAFERATPLALVSAPVSAPGTHNGQRPASWEFRTAPPAAVDTASV